MSLVFGRGCIGCLQHERCDKGGILCFIVFIFLFFKQMVCSLVLEWEVGVGWCYGLLSVCMSVSARGVVLESVAFLYGVCFLFFSFKHNGLSLRMRNESNKCIKKMEKVLHFRISIRLWLLAF